MQPKNNILQILKEKESDISRLSQRGLVIQPGALGDCILTLPLVYFMKKELKLGSVDFLGHTDYISIFSGRTPVNSIISIDALELHRLFTDKSTFDIPDKDPLIDALSGYSWIISFLGEPNSDFEENLIFTVNCCQSAEVEILRLKPDENEKQHISEFYIQQLITSKAMPEKSTYFDKTKPLIAEDYQDSREGQILLNEIDSGLADKPVIIAPGSGSMQKCWHVENFIAIAEHLKDMNKHVFFLLGPTEMEKFPKSSINRLQNKFPTITGMMLSNVLSVLCSAHMYIGNDSGVTHLAASLGIRTYALFGPTNPDIYKPIGPDVTVIKEDSPHFHQSPSKEIQIKLFDAIRR